MVTVRMVKTLDDRARDDRARDARWRYEQRKKGIFTKETEIRRAEGKHTATWRYNQRKKGIFTEETKRQHSSPTEGCAKGHKRCSSCREEKAAEFFHKNKAHKSGLSQCCNSCTSKSDKAYREKNKEKLIEYKRQYYQENKERLRAYGKEQNRLSVPQVTKNLVPGEVCKKCGGAKLISYGPEGRWTGCRDCKNSNKKEWSKKNPERIRENKSRDYEKHKEKRMAQQKIWRKANPEKRAVQVKKRNLRICKDLTDAYVRGQIASKIGVKNPPQELIEAKRVQLRITRVLREMVKTPAN